jgi:hypothetical protein
MFARMFDRREDHLLQENGYFVLRSNGWPLGRRICLSKRAQRHA